MGSMDYSPNCLKTGFKHRGCKIGPLMTEYHTLHRIFLSKLSKHERKEYVWEDLTDEQWWLIGFWQFTYPDMRPSLSDYATDLWEPSSREIEANLRPGFGSSIAMRHPEYCNGKPDQRVQILGDLL